MSGKKRNSNQLVDKIDRRSVLKSIGAGAGIVSGASLPNTAAADRPPLISAKELDGRKKEFYKSIAESFEQFQIIREKIQNERDIRVNEDAVSVLKVEGRSGKSGHIVSFPLGDDASVTEPPVSDIAVVIQNQKPQSASAAVVENSTDDMTQNSAFALFDMLRTDPEPQYPSAITNYEISDTQQQNTQTDTAVDVNKTPIEFKSGIDEDTEHVHVDASEEGVTIGSRNDLETAGIDIPDIPDFPDLPDLPAPDPPNVNVGNINLDFPECFACKSIGTAICAVGCSVGMASVCGSLAFVGGPTAPVTTGTCTAIGAAFCAVLTSGLEKYAGAACYADINVELTCYYASFCDPREELAKERAEHK